MATPFSFPIIKLPKERELPIVLYLRLHKVIMDSVIRKKRRNNPNKPKNAALHPPCALLRCAED
ncbi:hypothetical protein FOC1_g10012873 [Fusarium oxysporum f. sp. cubense race 1]|uniref:Uncharacterized protein n=1 Tax=Fusarium oxysporum f. sp. cubense (strain race 1) TaxID=1229664 RepID=N4U1H2_FUSC1|nr:hypothetical protein FOC1_g10012873 [Fusarium oxysporum f. sp. cubense race 1]